MTVTNIKDKKLKVLMIGPLPPPIGGISVSQKILLDFLNFRMDVGIEVVDVNVIRKRKGYFLCGLIHLFMAVIEKSRRVDVVTVYLASTALPFLGLMLLIICRVIRKPLIIRKAANFDYYDLGPVRGRIAHFVVKYANMYLAETKNLVSLAQERGIFHVRWYPTNRSMDNDVSILSLVYKSCQRFVYVGQVRECKGIREVIHAVERFDDGISLDIYGPLFDDLDPNIFQVCNKVKYCGVLPPQDVISTLKRYDMLLLPTKALSEGYPGVVFEGYSAGLPVITTRCGGIPEIVDETSGIFVEPGNTDALFDAIRTVVNNDDIYNNLKHGVYAKRNEFDSAIWADRFVVYCREVIYL